MVPCDISQDPPIAKGFAKPHYNVVMSILCLESVCESKDDYKAAIRKLTSLIKPGGYLLLYCSLNTIDSYGHYHIGENKFTFLGVSLEFVLQSLKDGGLSDVHYSLLPEEDLLKAQKYYDCNEDGFVFVIAKYGAK